MTRHPSTRIPGITELPPSGAGMRIGLFGGSFNPAHEGHRLVAQEALCRLNLNALWVLVTPGNPLKNNAGLLPLALRVQAARRLLVAPKIHVTGFEAAHGFAYSWQTLRFLTRSLADRHFIWLMGADNLVSFHRWDRWRDIAAMLPIAIYVRPGSGRAAVSSRVAMTLARTRLNEDSAPHLAWMSPPAWIYLHGRQSTLSSSAIRAQLQAALSK